jgi:hypothetical protein
MYTRAQGVDFDDWETKGWSADDLLPFMKRVCCPNFQAHLSNNTDHYSSKTTT